MSITYAQWGMGREVTYPPSQEIRDNAAELLRRVNGLLDEYAALTGIKKTQVNSGYRPLAINAATPGASLKSLHITGRAIDINDDDGTLDAFMLTSAGKDLLNTHNLWHEHPSKTPRWCHFSSAAFGSYRPGGTRTFMP
jgi:hypothetical protein